MSEVYVTETFTPAEQELLRRHFSNLDRPVFALRGLPEVVKGALFARYSRSPKSLRRLFLDEFSGDEFSGDEFSGDEFSGDEFTDDASADADATEAEAAGSARAERLYDRVFVEYGDDSVAQLGGAHVAVEQVSNLVTKILEWGRLASYLEQSTRYMTYDDKPGGTYRYHRPAEIMASRHAEDYVATMDAVFDIYADLVPRMRAELSARFPRGEATSERAWRNAITAKTCDILRGLLPAATVSNVGVYASGQAYESMLLRLRSSELAEARAVGEGMLTELRTVIPAFLTRVDRPDRGEVWSDYLAETRAATRAVAAHVLAGVEPEASEDVTLTWFDPDAEVELVAGILYPHTHLPETQLRQRVAAMNGATRQRVIHAYVGDRTNRRHKPGRAFERVSYRFDVCSDYGAFRDLQRHRMLTIEWQELSCRHGYETPAAIDDAGLAPSWHRAMELQSGLWRRLQPDFPRAAQYAVGFAWKMRYAMHMNARAAMQMLELRTGTQGHESYRRICQRMHTLIAEEAGHRVVADAMRFVDHSGASRETAGTNGTDVGTAAGEGTNSGTAADRGARGSDEGRLERLAAEEALERRRAAVGR